MDVTLEGSSTMIFLLTKSSTQEKRRELAPPTSSAILPNSRFIPFFLTPLCLSNLEVGGVEIQETSYEGLVSDQQIVWPSPDDEIPFWKRDFPSWNVNPEVPNESSVKDSDLMHIIHVTAEMAPIAKVGGLGDVVTGLARASLSRGHTVDIVLPFYECIQKQQINDLALIIIFIEPSNEFFKGQQVYGGSYNELEAYLFFSRACLEWMQVTDTQPDIIHVHEWQIGALPLLYWDMYRYLSLKGIYSSLISTLQNLML
ncbi:hypothetical protein OIU85_012116 [Salix viminalis]|uniref:starch synthase n=1 Tax=Salix viminalis TaxID=40686 RepID=A0A9Q0NNV0_SALVM|nr:hypothetical protein OIU85_012116 [Salix viminalis]